MFLVRKLFLKTLLELQTREPTTLRSAAQCVREVTLNPQLFDLVLCLVSYYLVKVTHESAGGPVPARRPPTPAELQPRPPAPPSHCLGPVDASRTRQADPGLGDFLIWNVKCQIYGTFTTFWRYSLGKGFPRPCFVSTIRCLTWQLSMTASYRRVPLMADSLITHLLLAV